VIRPAPASQHHQAAEPTSTDDAFFKDVIPNRAQDHRRARGLRSEKCRGATAGHGTENDPRSPASRELCQSTHVPDTRKQLQVVDSDNRTVRDLGRLQAPYEVSGRPTEGVDHVDARRQLRAQCDR
jgi:hypothetical protein